MDLKNKFVKYLNKFNNLIQFGGWTPGEQVKYIGNNAFNGKKGQLIEMIKQNLWTVKIDNENYDVPQSDLQLLDETELSFHVDQESLDISSISRRDSQKLVPSTLIPELSSSGQEPSSSCQLPSSQSLELSSRSLESSSRGNYHLLVVKNHLLVV